jgi:low temperature requirement protein LtrA
VAARTGEEERVTPLELFFDLVFVFALTQVTGLVAVHPTWAGLGKGLLVLGLLWWAWTAYAWLTNTVNPEEGVVRLAMFGAMAAMLIASLAVPEAFDEDALVFAVAYAAVRVAHIALYALAGRGDRELLRAVATLVPGTTVGVTLLVAAAFTDGWAQGLLWTVALVVDLAGPAVFGARGWRLSPGHFAERHGLIVIIALGESIVAVGVGAAGLELRGARLGPARRRLPVAVIAGAVLGLAVAAGLWWAYFDVVALVAERRLREATGEAQAAMARDSYSYLHFPMVAGIIMFALGMKKTLEHVGDPLETVPAVALCGGLAVYLVAHVLFRLRNVRTLSRRRVVAAAALVAVIPLAVEIPALASLAVVAAIWAALVAYETIRFAEARDRVRHAAAVPP